MKVVEMGGLTIIVVVSLRINIEEEGIRAKARIFVCSIGT